MGLVEYWYSTIGDWNTLMELVQNDAHFVKNIWLEVIFNFPYDWMFWNLFTMIDDRHQANKSSIYFINIQMFAKKYITCITKYNTGEKGKTRMVVIQKYHACVFVFHFINTKTNNWFKKVMIVITQRYLTKPTSAPSPTQYHFITYIWSKFHLLLYTYSEW